MCLKIFLVLYGDDDDGRGGVKRGIGKSLVKDAADSFKLAGYAAGPLVPGVSQDDEMRGANFHPGLALSAGSKREKSRHEKDHEGAGGHHEILYKYT